jgi:hypothetical protein
MSKLVRIPMNLYNRLGAHSQGFESPVDVIEKLLEFYEYETGEDTRESKSDMSERPNSLEIIFFPDNDEDKFKKEFLIKKKAYIHIHKFDGELEIKEWSGKNFTADSSVSGNLRSGYLRGWKQKGIIKAEITTNKEDLHSLLW